MEKKYEISNAFAFQKMVRHSGFKDVIAEGTNEMQVSDGYHTMDELYDHRICLWIALCKLWEETRSQSQWKEEDGRKYFTFRSKFHSDGSFFDGWFVLGIINKDGKQLTYHLPTAYWNECDFAKEFEKSPKWDGHTPDDVLERLKEL